MTEWLISIAAIVVFLIAMPWLVRTSKRSSSRKSRFGSGSAAMGDALSGFSDPAKKVTVEQVERQKEVGNASDGAVGEKL